MEDIFNISISVYNGLHDNVGTVATIRQFLNSTKHIDEVMRLRQTTDPGERQRIKSSLPAATLSGRFCPSRSASNLIEHSGLVCVDIDGKDNPGQGIMEMKTRLSRCRNIAYMALSISGGGLYCIIPITCPAHHGDHVRALQRDFSKIGITIDKACKDVTRLRVLSYDPEPYENQAAEPYSATYREPRRAFVPYRGADDTMRRVEDLVKTCELQHIDITDGYDNWFNIGAALASLGEPGREFYHRLSALNAGYKTAECDRKFDNLLKTCGRIGIGTLFHVAQGHGVIIGRKSL